MIAGNRSIVAAQSPVPYRVALMCQREQITTRKERVDTDAVYDRRGGSLRYVVVPLLFFRRAERSTPELRSVVEVDSANPEGLLHRPLDRGHKDGVVPYDGARLPKGGRRCAPGHGVV